MPLVPQDQLQGPTWSSIANIGRPKTGKTQSLRTMHDYLIRKKLPRRIEFFDWDEDGADTIIRIAKQERWNLDPTDPKCDLAVYRYNLRGTRLTNQDVRNRSKIPIEQFIQEFNGLYDDLDPKTGYWKEGKERGCVVLDSITALNERYFDFVLQMNHKEVGGTLESGANISFNEWTKVKEKMVEAIRGAKGLPCFSVCNFHEAFEQEEIPGPKPGDAKTTGRNIWTPAITGDLRITIQKEFSVVIHSRAVDDRYFWITRPTEEIRSVGSRNRDLLPETVLQDFANILPE